MTSASPSPEHDADVLVVERVAADEDPVADLDPAVRHTHAPVHRSGADAGRVGSGVPSSPTRPAASALLTRHWPLARGPMAPGRSRGQPDRPRARRALRAATSTSATSWRRPGSTRTPTTIAGTAARGGRRGDIDRWSRYHDDLAGATGGRACRRPTAGRSCCTAIRWAASSSPGYLLTDRPRPDLAVLTAPGLDSTLARLEEARWRRVLGRIVPTSGGSPTASTAEHAVARSGGRPTNGRDDPLLRKTSTARFGAEALAEQARVRAGGRGDSACRRSSSTGSTTGSSRPRPSRCSRALPASSGGPTRACATSSTTSPNGPQISTASSAGSAQVAGVLALRGTTEHRLRGAPRALRVWRAPQTRGT